ncbi:MAG: Tex family protein, partial [Gordonia sp. (in: high G+C Gram-positive bacteria)]|uniref:Tex-like N-terminal domain-containing protein n=1 Tax=Gordonia sp. (in: high G+C Gram-positive bacteria) TaxID=84139 RepID=UPI003BB77674
MSANDQNSPRRTPKSSVIARIAEDLGVAERQVAAAVKLLDDGATVPFIARYRKEVTGSLDDVQLRRLDERLTYLRELDERRAAVIDAIDEQGKLTDALRAALLEADTKARVEDIYLPYKKKRRTKAQIAREAGLAPLADALLGNPSLVPEAAAAAYLNDDVADAAAALDGARHILIERAGEDAELVGAVRTKFWAAGQLGAEVKSEQVGATPAGQKFRDYFSFSEALESMPSHRVLAVLRGEKEGVLSLAFDGGDDEDYIAMVAATLGIDRAAAAPATAWLATTARWAWRTKLMISATIDARLKLRHRAEEQAVGVFATNLKDLLLAAPAGTRPTLGLDPGLRTGVKVAVVDGTGKVLDTCAVYPHQPANKWEQSKVTLAGLIATHDVELVAIGNGTASRETDALTAELIGDLRNAGQRAPTKAVVSEAGASVYSASEYASTELPDLDVSLRGAVSIARRLQDPLAELVKIDPKSIGVGQYQHDITPSTLATSLDVVVEDAVNAVGVDLNTASVPLLARVSGVTPTLAAAIVAHRDGVGAFRSRAGLLDVPRLGPKAFEQCAGFLRIVDGDDPLDASGVHPEAYPVVRRILDTTGMALGELIGDTRTLRALTPAVFADDRFGVPTVTDIISELEKP